MERALLIGASGGIGAALGRALNARGAEVVGLSRQGSGFEITDEMSVATHLSALSGSFDTVLITSGILAPPGKGPEKALSALDPAAMAQVFAVNAIGPALVLKHLVPLIPRDRRCAIGVLTARVGSIGDNRMGGWYSYRAAKAAANQITKTAAIELSRRHKQAVVVALHPGTVETPFTASYRAHAKHSPDQAAGHLLAVLDSLNPAQSGGFYDWAGKQVDW